ncbi:MAG: hypothetical protein AB7K36_18190 [Chloroflexota bacterium]
MRGWGIGRGQGHPVRVVLMLALVLSLCWQASSVAGQIAQGATLTVLRGTVSVVRADGSLVYPAESGLLLQSGDRVATVRRSSALVTFFEGSEVELGADTTIAIHELDVNSSGETTILIENVLGSTVHRIVSLALNGSSYRIEANGTVTDVRGTVLGNGVDDDGNVTVYLVNSSGPVTFPNDGTPMQNGQVCTYSTSGDLQCAPSNGKDVWSALADGVQHGQTNGTGNPGAATGSNASGQKDDNPEDDVDNGGGPTATPTPTLFAPLFGSPTLTHTPTATVTVTPTPTSTIGPCSAGLLSARNTAGC